MRNFARLMTVVALCGFIPSCGPADRGHFRGMVHREVLAKADLFYYWWPVQLPLDEDEDEAIERLYLLDETIYCLSNRNRLYAVDAASGNLKWSHSIGRAEDTIFPPCHSDRLTISEKPAGVHEMMGWKKPDSVVVFDAVLVNTASELLVFDREKGTLYRTIPFKDFVASCGGAVDGSSFYVGSTSGRYYSMRLNEAVKAWGQPAGKLITAPVGYYNGLVFVAGGDNVFYTARTGRVPEPGWSQQMEGPITAAFSVDDRGCFVPCEDNRLYGLDPLNGGELWTFMCEGPLRQPVQVAARTVFQYASGDGLYAIDLVNGTTRWHMPEGRRLLAVMNRAAYVLDERGQLVVVDEILGEVKRTLALTGFDLLADNVRAPAIYGASKDGRVFCLRLQGSGRLTREDLAKKPAE